MYVSARGSFDFSAEGPGGSGLGMCLGFLHYLIRTLKLWELWYIPYFA